MPDVVKTLKIKKAGPPGNVPPPKTAPNAVPAIEGQPAAPAQNGHVTLSEYLEVQTTCPAEKTKCRSSPYPGFLFPSLSLCLHPSLQPLFPVRPSCVAPSLLLSICLIRLLKM
jgi:hypothetical protein